MDTYVNNPASRTDRTYIERTGSDDTAGWAIAIIVLLAALALGLFFWTRAHNGSVAPSTTNINVTNPADTGSSGAVNPSTGSGQAPASNSDSGDTSGAGASGSVSGQASGNVSGGASGAVTPAQ